MGSSLRFLTDARPQCCRNRVYSKLKAATGKDVTETNRSPANLRRMFGANLKQLACQYPSVSELCRQLGINRTQFNRYLAGESFPRPDVLDRICRFFDVDARILLKPLDEIEPSGHPASEIFDRFLSDRVQPPFAPGFYHAAEAASGPRQAARHRLVFVRQIRHCTLLRSYEPRCLMPETPASAREVQGIASRVGGQIYTLMSRRGAQDCQMMVLSEHPGAVGQRWTGHVYRMSEGAAAGSGAQRLELHYLGYDLPAVLQLGRKANAC
ncbi:transcriptional regulator, XRE family [Rhodobacteraceae bacterium KLH11]|nr:transcriptional regulator, XRE family [Rhodobacteraceae bacterium KLH11]